jgi:hypothetical protein
MKNGEDRSINENIRFGELLSIEPVITGKPCGLALPQIVCDLPEPSAGNF